MVTMEVSPREGLVEGASRIELPNPPHLTHATRDLTDARDKRMQDT